MSHRSGARRVVAVILALALWCLSLSAHALSCTGVDDRFFVQCSDGRCNVSFRARDVPAPGACARRTVVESVPVEVAELVLRRVSTELVSGDYEVTLEHRYYAAPPVSAEELNRAFGQHELKAPRVRVSRTSGANVDQLRADWAERSRRSVIGLFAYWATEVALLVGALYALYRTISAFRRRLQEVPRRSFVGPLLLQLGLLALAILSLGSPTWPVLLALVAPVILVVWVCELGAYTWVRYRSRAAHEF